MPYSPVMNKSIPFVFELLDTVFCMVRTIDSLPTYKVASLNANLASEARDSNVMVLTIGKGANIINSNINLAISK